MLKCTNVLKKNVLCYSLKKNICLYSTYSSFLPINLCNQGKTLCSSCISARPHILETVIFMVTCHMEITRCNGSMRTEMYIICGVYI